LSPVETNADSNRGQPLKSSNTYKDLCGSEPKRLVPESGIVNRTYDITPDGERLLMVKPVGETEQLSSPTELHVVFNGFAELERLVPTEK
jgi:hypothetical protein